MASQCPRRAKTIGFPPPTHTHGDTPADRGDGPVRASGACGTIIAPETPWKEWWSEAPSWGSVVAAARMSSPCAMRWLGHASDCLRGRPAEPRRLAVRCAIVTCSRSAWTAGAVDRLGPSLSALRDAEGRRVAVIRRRAGQPRQLKQAIHSVLDTLGAVVARAPEAPPLQHPCCPFWWPGARALRWTTTSRPSRIGSDLPRQTDSPRSRPSQLNSSTSSRRGGRRTLAARRRRRASAPSTRRAS